MAEFRNCEEYVLNLLNESQNEVAHQEEVIRELNQRLGEIMESFQKLKDLIVRNSSYHEGINFNSYISFNSLIEGWDPDFDEIIRLVPKIPQPKE